MLIAVCGAPFVFCLRSCACACDHLRAWAWAAAAAAATHVGGAAAPAPPPPGGRRYGGCLAAAGGEQGGARMCFGEAAELLDATGARRAVLQQREGTRLHGCLARAAFRRRERVAELRGSWFLACRSQNPWGELVAAHRRATRQAPRRASQAYSPTFILLVSSCFGSFRNGLI